MIQPADLTASPGTASITAGSVAAAPGSTDSFEHALEEAAARRDRAAVRRSAAQLVSSTFILPVLQSLHDSPFLQEPFAPGFAEKRFMPLLDQHLADRITSAAGFPLVDVITDRLLGPEEPDHAG